MGGRSERRPGPPAQPPARSSARALCRRYLLLLPPPPPLSCPAAHPCLTILACLLCVLLNGGVQRNISATRSRLPGPRAKRPTAPAGVYHYLDYYYCTTPSTASSAAVGAASTRQAHAQSDVSRSKYIESVIYCTAGTTRGLWWWWLVKWVAPRVVVGGHAGQEQAAAAQRRNSSLR